ncbi:MAG: hypothetical protein B7Z20_06085 [Sphingobium sp. 32-64-5]|nr:MAG: hypothetical protein B7Z20_06085 [Sphingobium sp. 32-64-5]
MRTIFIAGSAIIAAALALGTTAAHAEGLGVEGNYGRADGHWGTELGAGYGFDLGGFSVTPGAGVYLRDGDTKLYGRIEAGFTLPASATIGAGLRFSGDNTRPYATIAFPVLPMVDIKANAGPHYVAAGIRFGY